jgi:coenzyme PQQ synthesis protein D (PqqD)
MNERQTQRYRVNATISAAPMPDGAVLIDSATGECFELNRTGARVWESLVRGEELDGVVDAIAAESSVQRSVVAADTATLIDALARRGIIVANR